MSVKSSKDVLIKSLPTVIPAEIPILGFDEIIDVRSPSEFLEDHVQGAINLPVLDDEQRSEVGRVYKQVSAFEARRMGAGLVSANIARHFKSHFHSKGTPYKPLIYCWRGGQRSGALATVLSEVGWQAHLLGGGYREYRKFVSHSLEGIFNQRIHLRVISGLTGSGKTYLLKRLDEKGQQIIDLEGLAQHKGSALGDDPQFKQPSQKRFENLLLRKLSAMDFSRPVYVESESSRIGRLQVPAPMWSRMKEAPVLELEVPLRVRADYLLGEYEHFTKSPEKLLQKMDPILSMHGSKRGNQWKTSIDKGDYPTFVASLLEDHYDPAYLKSRNNTYPAPVARLEMERVCLEALDQVVGEVLNLEQSTLLQS